MMKRTLIQLGISFLVLASVLGAYAFCYNVLVAAKADAAALAAEIGKKSQEASRIQETRDALEGLAADEAVMQGYLIRQEDIVPFLTMLEERARELGSTLEVVSVSAEKGAERGRILLSLRVDGSFDAVLRTLGSIEYGPYDAQIQSVTFDTPGNAMGTSTAPLWTAAATFAFGTRDAQAP
ncbi:MAG: hypothetical protein V4644_01995 [Patescibacteria group bacterium]